MRLSLHRHPDTPCVAIATIDAEVTRGGDGVLNVRYMLEGAMDDVVIAPPEPPARADGLWKTTCLEAFVAAPSGGAYAEYNFSPSARWAAYAFTGYRAGMTDLAMPRPPRIRVDRHAEGLSLEATFPILPRGAARLGLAAVIEETSGAKSYWALVHGPDKPDFHHSCGFALALPAEPS
jgi:hypothetical protein